MWKEGIEFIECKEIELKLNKNSRIELKGKYRILVKEFDNNKGTCMNSSIYKVIEEELKERKEFGNEIDVKEELNFWNGKNSIT